MRIIIVGDGKVGHALAEQLSNEGHDVVVVDSNAEALRKAIEKLDVLCIQGSGASADTLREAGVKEADIFIAVTSSDEMNMICCLMAHKMGAKKIIARIRNPEYANTESMLRDDLGIDLTINPELFAAGEISRLLRFPHAHSIETFARGRVEMIEFLVGADAPNIGKPLRLLRPTMPCHVLFAVVVRGDEVLIPDGDFAAQEGDHLHIVGEPTQTLLFAKYMGHVPHKVRTVMIVGGSRIAFYLARQLHKLGMRARILELEEKRARQLSALLPEAVVILGDGTDQDILDQENLRDMDAFVALTDRDEENILAALHAKDAGVGKAVAKVTRTHYARLAEGVSVISPKDLTADRIVRYVRAMVNSEGSFVERLYRIVGGQAEAVEFCAHSGSRILGVPLKDMRLKSGVLVAAIVHKNQIVIPFGNDVVREGDTVIIVTKGLQLTDLNDILIGG